MTSRPRTIAALAFGLLWFLAAVPPAVATDDTVADYDGRSTEDTVQLVVGSLVAIAVLTAVLLVAYVWHTSPRRRARVAARRSGPDVVDGPVR